MSEYNIQMNKYNALNAGYDQLYPQPMKHANTHAEDGNDPITPSMIGTYNKTEIDTALQNKAPAGYGLGKNVTNVSLYDAGAEGDLNNATNSGLYLVASTNANKPDGYTGEGLLEVLSGTAHGPLGVQRFYPYGASAGKTFTAIRWVVSGNTWQPWEWVNPPMELGKEYRTTERYSGKPVYAKLVDFGALPNKTSKTVEHGIANISYVINWGGVLANGSTIPLRLYDTETIDGEVSRTSIKIFTTYDRSGWTCRVWMKYTKTTD